MPPVSLPPADARLPSEPFHISGIDGFLRIMTANLHQQNNLADQKANIMISINTVILSLLIGSTARNVDSWRNLLIPITLLVVTCLITTVLAVLATRPRLIRSRVSPESIRDRSAQLLFFGNFIALPLQEYEDTMMSVLNDADYVYRNMLRDYHAQGIVLSRKYKLLYLAYNTFLIGLIGSVVATALRVWWFQY